MSEEKNIPPEKKSEDQNKKQQPVPETNSQRFPEDKQAPATKELQTKNDAQHPADKPETENMEFHHQHHHAPGKKKHFKHYLFEFLMLFLAITLGFFVENQREHYIEHKRAKQYAAFLFSDLVKDTLRLNIRTEYMQIASKKLDTLIMLLKYSGPQRMPVDKIYSLTGYVYANFFFGATTSTMEQLKNSGSLRYFRNNKLIGQFSNYDNSLQNLKTVEDRNAYLTAETRKFLAQFLDLKSIPFYTTIDSSGITAIEPLITQPLELYRNEATQFQQFANWCTLKQLDLNNRARQQINILNSARTLILSLKKEFHLQ